MQAELPKLMDLAERDRRRRRRSTASASRTTERLRPAVPAGPAARRGGRALRRGHHRPAGTSTATSRTRSANTATAIDKPIAGLLADLKARGLLKDTLVIWGGEFGRTPYAQGDDGRDHNNKGFTIWMAGGGVKGGLAYGETDDYGYEAVEGKVHIHDWHATILHLLGLDHEKLTYRYAGRDMRLTDVKGNVVKDVMA